MHSSSLFLALAAASLSSALATFTINMKTTSGFHPLALVKNGTSGHVLEASTKGTPAYFKNSEGGDYESLHMLLSGTAYGIEAPKVGHDYGHAASVYGLAGAHQKQWEVTKSGEIRHEDFVPRNALFYCNDDINGRPGTFLKFGTPKSNGNPPKGCDNTVLKKVS